MDSAINTATRLLMRYDSGTAFNFRHLAVNAPDEGVFTLATAFASVQREQPTQISVVVTRQLMF
jgi:hypothetical protein